MKKAEIMRVAIVHYWLVGMRGGEKVLEALCECYPTADVFTHVYDPRRVSDAIRSHAVHETFIGRLPAAKRVYPLYLPLMPLALEQLDLTGYDLVISSESGPAKGVITRPDALHVCYCHTPMRYLWNAYHSYRAQAPLPVRVAMVPFGHRLRLWDFASAARVDRFIANSQNVATRIRKYYRRDAVVVHPPVDRQAAEDARGPVGEDFYLHVGQLVGYKRADVAVRAFNLLAKPLVVLGGGPQMRSLTKIAGSTVRLIGPQNPATLAAHYDRCRALVFAADEDFGIVPVEAMSAGRPVIAFGSGGALETVIPGVTGIFFDAQTPESLADAVRRYEKVERAFDPRRIAHHAESFGRSAFKDRFLHTVEGFLQEHEAALGRGVRPDGQQRGLRQVS